MRVWNRCSRLLSSAICSCICGLFGASCTDGPYRHMAEYGVPRARYKVDGVVRDDKTHTAIPGIRVRIFGPEYDDTTGAARSDGAGHWSIDVTRHLCFSACSLKVEDVDGPVNAPYKDKTVPFDPVKTEPGSGWFEGTFEQHDIAIELESSAAPQSHEGALPPLAGD